MKHVRIYGSLIKETEKALNIELNWQHNETVGKNQKYDVWIPKSQASVSTPSITIWGSIEIEVPTWLADKIGNEIREKYEMPKHLGGNGIVYNFK